MSVTAAAGFRASGVTAGLKPSGRPDVALVVNDGPSAAAAAVFTSNRCKANPVLWSEQAMRRPGDAGGTTRAVVLNSGGANCYTGADGFALTHRTAETVAEALDVGAADVQVCSTGLIGVRSDPQVLLAGAKAAVAALGSAGGQAAAEAIMTTDTVTKQASVTVGVDGAGFTVGGMAKGAGMLAPALATMLVVVTTDAVVDPADCDRALREATRTTFDRIDSDGCMSTNDTVLLMASGTAAAPDLAAFTAALSEVCHDLAQQLLSDAEGSEHDIAIEVRGAASEDDAVEVARSVARSALFKCAVFGRDPNWGRILAAVGTTGAAFDPADLDVALNGVQVCRGSQPGAPADAVDLSEREVSVTIDLKTGESSATVWTNDLTHAYVHENSAYST
ncbi:MAG: bifunctional ornithine acetyltransferase/N-acetylglutamate synthase [Nocardioidaceae bacterium]|nr:bifunctional ornithine acetyltransferase/N-acetylglutamate synthase [Nocardioidaceae bacterium]